MRSLKLSTCFSMKLADKRLELCVFSSCTSRIVVMSLIDLPLDVNLMEFDRKFRRIWWYRL